MAQSSKSWREVLPRMQGPNPAFFAASFVFILFCGSSATQTTAGDRIRVVPNEAGKRVDISIDGQPFAAYIWPPSLAKPVLYPLRTAKGTVVTRGYPLEPRPGERVDHPHHAGLWFNYGNASDIDFWNNSDAIKPENRGKMGTIHQRSIVAARRGTEQGKLEVDTDWTADHKLLLREHSRFVFRGGPKFQSIDRVTTLEAPNQKVAFRDDKEGLLTFCYGVLISSKIATGERTEAAYQRFIAMYH